MAIPPPVAAVVGRSVPRQEGVDKVTGRAVYTDDLQVPGAWYGTTVRSSVPRGIITDVSLDPAFDWSDTAVVTAADIPGANVVQLIDDDQPVLAHYHVNHREEPIVLVAAPTGEMANAAAAHVHIEYEELEPLFDASKSDKIYKTIDITKGDVEAALADADVVVERSFSVGLQEQLYIEPQAAIAIPREDGGVTVHGSLQCPFYVQRALKRALKLDDSQAVVIQAETGGGFGGKEEYPSIIALHAALLALKANRPVRLIYDRQEDLAATTKRHPGTIRHRTGVLQDGTLVAQDIDIVLDGGAYSTLTPVVLSRSAIHASGPYACPNVHIHAIAVGTNTPPNGAFRGFGAPQSQFASELMVEHVAERLHLGSTELRRKWMLRVGDSTATGQVLTESVSSHQVLDTALKAARSMPNSADSATLHGRGLALVYHGSGFTGSGETQLSGRVAIEAAVDGTYRVLTASTEIGQGTRTILCQIAAQALGVPVEHVTLPPQDTSLVPDSGPTVASRTAMIVGGIVRDAADELRAWLELEPPPLRVYKTYVSPQSVRWNEDTYRGDAYPTYGWGCVLVDVDVDTDTGEVRITDIVSAVDVGKAIHPVMVEGQIEGGTLQAVGYATIEEVKTRNGGYMNDRLATYIIPTSLDAPRTKVILIENPYSDGPFGAKGVGELPMDAPAPAIISAIHDATGVWLDEIPATPEKVLEALSR
ncbi:MAG: xanthine dehydrogenase family protein molybdopterin-binding subunit [Gemmatimonadales bacterium]